MFAGFCALCWLGAENWALLPDLIAQSGFAAIFLNSLQLNMALALPFMALYNGQRGRPVKWFFYWYYPLHRTALYTAQALLG